MSKLISNRKLAAALGISPARVTALAKRGMPTDSVAAAEAWRDANLDPSWARKRPPAELELTDAGPEVSAPPDPVEHVLCHVAFPMLTRPEMLALACREANAQITGEQALRAAGFCALLVMDQIGRALGKDDLQFAVGHFPQPGSAAHAELAARLEMIFQRGVTDDEQNHDREDSSRNPRPGGAPRRRGRAAAGAGEPPGQRAPGRARKTRPGVG